MESTFTLAAKPGTDIWRKPPSTDVFDAPFRPHTIAPLSHFQSATITFTAAYTALYDQAGLLLTFTNAASGAQRKWIKAGIEFLDGAPVLSTVCCDRWADWSVSPVPKVSDDVQAGRKSISVRVEREYDPNGVSLWVHYVPEDGGKAFPMRECCWVFADGGEGWELEVSALVARPNKDAKNSLEAKFEKFDVKWEETK